MKNEKTPPSSGLSKKSLLTLLGVLLFALSAVLYNNFFAPSPEEVPLTQIVSEIEDGNVESAKLIDSSRLIEVTLKEDEQVLTSGYPIFYGTELLDKLTEADVEVDASPIIAPSLFSTLLISLLPIILIIGFFIFYLGRKGGGMGIGKLSGKKGSPVEIPETRFEDVAGADEVVNELKEVTEFLQKPERFLASGAKVPRGFLLAGPPGTGKTLLARAVAGEAGVPFYYLSGSDFVEVFVGVGASKMRQLFDKAKTSERAIIFIDEIDAVGKARSTGVQTGANEERENTLNALLTEMDGFSQTSGILILAATNRPEMLDPALVRPGRFDRTIVVGAPDRKGRAEIFKLHAKGLNVDPNIDFESLGRRTPGLTGADIAGLVNEAALESARREAVVVTRDHFEAALQTSVLGRERRSAIISERDQEITAWHESGHTVAAMVLEEAHDPVTVTIVPRGPAGGVTWMGGSDHDFMTRNQAKAQLVVAMAGRAAEEMLLKGDFTQGAQGDLKSATSLATQMVNQYGMGKMLVSLGEERIGSEDMHRINEEVSTMLEEALEVARNLMKENESLIREVASELLVKETLHYDDLVKVQESLNVKPVEDVIKEL